METKEPLEIITIREFDPDNHKHFGEKNKYPPKYEVTHMTQYPNDSHSGIFTSYAYTETQILRSFALVLELSMKNKAEVDFKLDNDYLHIKKIIDMILRHHNYFVNELEKQATTFGLLKLRSK
jgi:hypothetical protein